MEMTGERRLPASRDRVWQALNDPLVLREAIPGCESLEKLSDTELKATAAVKIGPITARFTGRVHFTDIDPPNAYRITGEGQGGVAGFAKGSATVRLAEDGTITVLTYEARAQVGGKMAQFGARLIDATARQFADAFFTRFADLVAAPEAGEAAAKLPGLLPPEPLGIPLAVWGVVLLGPLLVALGLLFAGRF